MNDTQENVSAAQGVIEMEKGDMAYLENAKECKACGYEGQIDMWGCPKCKGMGNYFWMENVNSLTVKVDIFIEEELKKFEIKLTGEQEDRIHEKVWEVLEEVGNGYYKNHN